MKSKYLLFSEATYIIFEISLILADKGNLQMHVFRYHSKKNWFITASVLFKESIKKKKKNTSGFIKKKSITNTNG